MHGHILHDETYRMVSLAMSPKMMMTMMMATKPRSLSASAFETSSPPFDVILIPEHHLLTVLAVPFAASKGGSSLEMMETTLIQDEQPVDSLAPAVE